MYITHKTECFPTIEQIQQIEMCFGMRRFFFNKTIDILKKKYGGLKENKALITKKEVMSYRKTVFRKGKFSTHTATVPSHILESAMEDVCFALDSLWRKGRNITFRKKTHSNTCRFGSSSSMGSFRLKDEFHIQLPRLGQIRLAEDFRFKDILVNGAKSIKHVTIKKEAGRYFIAMTAEVHPPKPHLNQNRHIGLDWGIKTYFTGYDGKGISEFDFDNEKLIKLDKRVRKNQKSLTRKVKNSKNYLKTKIKLQQSYLDLTNHRHQYINGVVNYLAENYDSVTLEGLSMRFVTKNRRLARLAHLKSFYLFKVTLFHKFKWYGKTIYTCDRVFPSTQKCNACGYVKQGDEKMKLGESSYVCNHCGHTDNRDANAAKNIYSDKQVQPVDLSNIG